MLTTTPHDVLIRVFATANALGAYPLNHLVYGPLLALLLLAGFVLLPRRTLFFCIVAAVIVPILSLQFHSRHVFYAVMFGAAALGLAYTLAAMAITALIDRTRRMAESADGVTRSALVAAATAASVVLIYGADELAIDRQQRALTALHQLYHDADWTPIEMVQSDSELRFPSLTPTAESKVGVMALSFAFPDPESNVGGISDLDWHTDGSAILTPHDHGFRLTSNDKGGYQLLSRAIRIEELSISSDPSPSATLSIRIRGSSDSSGWRIGALSHDETRWLDSVLLPRDALDLRATLIFHERNPPFTSSGIWPKRERQASTSTCWSYRTHRRSKDARPRRGVSDRCVVTRTNNCEACQ